MYDGKYVPTEEDMNWYNTLLRCKYSDLTIDDIYFITRIEEYMMFANKRSPEEIDEEIENGVIFPNAPCFGNMSPFEYYCETVGYYDRHPEKRPAHLR